MGRPKGGAAAASTKKPKAKTKQRGGVDFKVTTRTVSTLPPPPYPH
jgi:pre-rRNA-processing protein IPI1